MVIERPIFLKLSKHLPNKQVTVLTGMRRTGKTTLVKELIKASDIKQKFFFDLERLDNRKLFAVDNYEEIIQALTQQGADFSEKVLIALDEIQLTPHIPSVIKYLYDTYDIKFIVTGSSSYYIKNKFQESLAGRKKIFEVYPLHFGEYLAFKGISYKPTSDIYNLKEVPSEYKRLKAYYDDFIENGGFPEVVIAQQHYEKLDLLNDILSSYVNMDIIQLSDIRKTTELDQLIRLLAARIGSKLDISKLSSAIKLSRATIENYIEFLESTYLIKTIPVYATNPDREIVKAKKIYFHDTGIASICATLSGGAKFENTIFNQLHHFGEVTYYQLKTGKEIDFILDKKYCFEVKETGHVTDYRKLLHLAGNLNIDEGKVLVKNVNYNFENQVWGGLIR